MRRLARRTSLLVAFLAFVSSGCGSASRVVVLQHPQTKQTVQCKVDPWGDMSSSQIESCVKAHKQAGYTVVGDSDRDR
jgi:hypothetical protein